MGRKIDRRVEALEARSGLGPRDREQREREAGREILRRMTDEELDAYEQALKRLDTADGLEDEDLAILDRAEELAREVRGGVA